MTHTCDECGQEFDSYTAMRVHQSRVGHMEKPWRDKERLRELYVEKKMSGYDIAEELGCGENAVYSALDDYGIERRSQGETKRHKLNKEPACYRTHHRDGYEEWFNNHREKSYYVRVHRLAAIAWHGFESVAGSVVHHENSIPWDNREDNLEVLEDQSTHAELHMKDRDRDSMGRIT